MPDLANMNSRADKAQKAKSIITARVLGAARIGVECGNNVAVTKWRLTPTDLRTLARTKVLYVMTESSTPVSLRVEVDRPECVS